MKGLPEVEDFAEVLAGACEGAEQLWAAVGSFGAVQCVQRASEKLIWTKCVWAAAR